eukprot:3152248-Rhodomonas_salina.2
MSGVGNISLNRGAATIPDSIRPPKTYNLSFHPANPMPTRVQGGVPRTGDDRSDHLLDEMLYTCN